MSTRSPRRLLARAVPAGWKAKTRRLRRRARLAFVDMVANRRHTGSGRCVLVLRHPENKPHFYDEFLHWLARRHPEARALYRLAQTTGRLSDLSRVAAVVPWLQDPVQSWSPSTFRRMNALASRCDRDGIPVVNRVDRLTHAAKLEGARRMAAVGLRVPRMRRVTTKADLEEAARELGLPVIVRDDWSHGERPFLARTHDDLARAPMSQRPVAIEYIDVRNPDGYYRKYRYTVVGDLGVCQSVHATRGWVARGTDAEYTPALNDEEAAFVGAPLPEHALFVAARAALELDLLAFDFSRDATGAIVVWEANPYPILHLGSSTRRLHRRDATERVFAAMARLHLGRAGLPLPAGL